MFKQHHSQEQRQKQPKCPLTGKCINKMREKTRIVLSLKRKIPINVRTNLENIIQSEMLVRKEQILYDSTYMKNLE